MSTGAWRSGETLRFLLFAETAGCDPLLAPIMTGEMDTSRIAELLQPFLAAPLSAEQFQSISTYIDLLLRWNAHINLTAVRDPEQVVTRHFGESLFAARQLFPGPLNDQRPEAIDVIDVGSGAGFPGLPLKLWAPEIRLTLIESNHKKATFLREVCRALTLTDVNVVSGRIEDFAPDSAGVVTLRAVERFEAVLLAAARLVSPTGRLALLIGEAQAVRTRKLVPEFTWPDPIQIPLSSTRILLVGSRP